MRIIDNYPNVERTITNIESLMITEREYQHLTKISKSIREAAEKELNDEINHYGFIKHYIEQTIIKSDLKDISPIKKEIILANILLPDDVKIAEILNQNGFTLEQLKTTIRFRSLLKNIILNDGPIDKDLEDNFNFYKQIIKTIIEIFKQNFNIDDQTIILNRICEILTRHPNYFESKITKNINIR